MSKHTEKKRRVRAARGARARAMSSADDPFAVIGIMSHVPNRALRDVIRRSWLRDSAPRGVVARFVLRGIGAPVTARAEAVQHRDTVFLDARSTLGRKQGPLVSLFAWWRYASIAWRATFIGKADDDVYIHLSGLLAHLRASHAAAVEATGRSAPRMLWGAIEGAHFDDLRLRPAAFQRRFPVGYPCRKRRHGRCGSQQCGIGTCTDRYGGCGRTNGIGQYNRSLYGPFPCVLEPASATLPVALSAGAAAAFGSVIAEPATNGCKNEDAHPSHVYTPRPT